MKNDPEVKMFFLRYELLNAKQKYHTKFLTPNVAVNPLDDTRYSTSISLSYPNLKVQY